MRYTLTEAVDSLPRAIIVTGNNVPDSHVIPLHSRRRGQLISSATGGGVLTTAADAAAAGAAHAVAQKPV